WPGQSALGKCVVLGGKTQPCRPVVGITTTTNRMAILKDFDRMAQIYTNVQLSPNVPGPAQILVRTSPSSRANVATLVSAEVKRLVPRAMIVQLRPMEKIYESELRPWRLGATLFTAMGVLALIVAGVGM